MKKIFFFWKKVQKNRVQNVQNMSHILPYILQGNFVDYWSISSRRLGHEKMSKTCPKMSKKN